MTTAQAFNDVENMFFLPLGELNERTGKTNPNGVNAYYKSTEKSRNFFEKAFSLTINEAKMRLMSDKVTKVLNCSSDVSAAYKLRCQPSDRGFRNIRRRDPEYVVIR